jgi:hypothetical protein
VFQYSVASIYSNYPCKWRWPTFRTWCILHFASHINKTRVCGKYSIKHSSVKGKVEIFGELSMLCAPVTACTACCGFQIHLTFLTDSIYTLRMIACDQLAFVMEFGVFSVRRLLNNLYMKWISRFWVFAQVLVTGRNLLGSISVYRIFV